LFESSEIVLVPSTRLFGKSPGLWVKKDRQNEVRYRAG